MPYVQLRALCIVVVAHVQRSLTHRRTEGTLGHVSLLECDPQHTITRDLDASLFRSRRYLCYIAVQPFKKEHCTLGEGGEMRPGSRLAGYAGPCLIQRSTTSSTRRAAIRSMPTAATEVEIANIESRFIRITESLFYIKPDDDT